MDYAYANPSLCLISNSGPWYRVMSPLVPGGGSADKDYEAIFNGYLEKFAAAAHCAYCLMDFLPVNRKLSFMNVVDEVDNRSGGRVDDYVLLVHAPFIIEQLSTLTAHDPVRDEEISIEDSHFMIQYKKKAEQFSSLKHEKKRRKRVVCKSLMDKSCGGTIDYSVKDVPVRAKSKKDEPIVPINDKDYWQAQEAVGVVQIPCPCPVTSNQLLPPDLNHMLGDALEAWETLCNFRELLSLPYLSIEKLLDTLKIEGAYNNSADDYHAKKNLLEEVHVQLLMPVLLSNRGNDDLGGKKYCCMFGKENKVDSELSSSTTQMLWDTIQEICDGVTNPPTVVKQFLCQGDMWNEVLRTLLYSKGEVSTPEYIDIAEAMKSIVQDILISPSYLSIRNQEEIEGGVTSTDSHYPSSLHEVLDAIESGFYECGMLSDEKTDGISDELFSRKLFTPLKLGSKIDAYSSSLHSWYAGHILETIPSEKNVIIRFLGWGSGFDETYSVEGHFLAPHQFFSQNLDYRDTHPDLIPPSVKATIEAKGRSDYVKYIVRNSNYEPHMAIASDIERILTRYIATIDTSSDLLEVFRAVYQSKLAEWMADPAVGSRTDMQQIVSHLGSKSYLGMPLSLKIRALCWLCGEMVSSLEAKSFIENVMEQKVVLEKALKANKAKTEEFSEPALSSRQSPRFGKRSLDDMQAESACDSDKLSEGTSTTLHPDRLDCQVVADFDVCVMPIGKDRNENRYWLFPQDTNCSVIRIFREEHSSQNWTVYEDESDIQLLLSWLSDYGTNESALKQTIKTRMGVKPTDPSTLHPPSSSENIVPVIRAFNIDVTLGPEGMLEAGVKDLDGRVVVSAYKFNSHGRSCAKEAGILICDQLIALNDYPICSIASLQKAILKVRKECENDGKDRVTLSLVVLRHASPECSSAALTIALRSDAEFRSHFQRQLSQEHTALCNPSSAKGYLIPGNLVGMCLEMSYCVAPVYPSSPRYNFLGHMHFIEKISGILYTMQCSEHWSHVEEKDLLTALVSCLRNFLLDLAFALGQSDRLLSSNWARSRRRFRWTQCCRKANTLPKVAYCVFCLHQCIDWKELEAIASIVEASKVLQSVPKQVQNFVPKEKQTILFFGEDFNCTGNQPILESSAVIPKSTVFCTVLNVKYYKGGIGSKRIPYAKIALQTVDDAGGILASFSDQNFAVPSAEGERKRLNRLLNLAMFVLLAHPESAPFSSAVSINDCPNYYDIITRPMHMGEIQNKISNNAYGSVREFKDDIDLIRSNCVLYCSERYPSLLPMAEVVHTMAMNLTDRLFPRTEQSQSEPNGPPPVKVKYSCLHDHFVLCTTDCVCCRLSSLLLTK